jgi:hypothetical protein
MLLTIKSILFVAIFPAIIVTCFFQDQIGVTKHVDRRPAVEFMYVQAFSKPMNR